MYIAYTRTPLGLLRLESDGEALCAVQLAPARTDAETLCPVLAQTAAELAEYFAGQRRAFTVPLHMAGTPAGCGSRNIFCAWKVFAGKGLTALVYCDRLVLFQ